MMEDKEKEVNRKNENIFINIYIYINLSIVKLFNYW